MTKYWEDAVDYVKKNFESQEAVLIKVPKKSEAYHFNGSIGFIYQFQREWVILKVSGGYHRFRGDEILKLSI